MTSREGLDLVLRVGVLWGVVGCRGCGGRKGRKRRCDWSQTLETGGFTSMMGKGRVDGSWCASVLDAHYRVRDLSEDEIKLFCKGAMRFS